LFSYHITIASILSQIFVYQTFLNRLKADKSINSNHSFS
jgi:hypothetical protein